MKKMLITLFFIFAFGLLIPKDVLAQETCTELGFSFIPNPVEVGSSFSLNKPGGLVSGEGIILEFDSGQNYQLDCSENPESCSPGQENLITIEANELPLETTRATITYIRASGGSITCSNSISVVQTTENFCSPVGLSSVLPEGPISPNLDITFSGCIGAGTNSSNPCNGGSSINVTDISRDPPIVVRTIPITTTPGSCNFQGEFTRSFGGFSLGVYEAQLYIGNSPVGNPIQFEVESGQDQFPDEGIACTVYTSGKICTGTYQLDPTNPNRVRCMYQPNQCITCDQCKEPECTAQQITQCERSGQSYICTGPDNTSGIDTAIGCIRFANPNVIAAFFIVWGTRIVGGVAILMFILASFTIITSSGNPDKINEGKALFMAAIAGVLMLIFSVALLRFIGFDILKILTQ